MVCVKGNKAPGKKSTRNLEVVLKKGSNPVLGSSFLYQCCVCCRRFIFVLLTNSMAQLAPFALDNENRAEQERPIFVIMKLFE